MGIVFHSLPKGKEPIYRALELFSGIKATGQIGKIGVAAYSAGVLEWIIANAEAFDVVMSYFSPLAFEDRSQYLKELKCKEFSFMGLLLLCRDCLAVKGTC